MKYLLLLPLLSLCLLSSFTDKHNGFISDLPIHADLPDLAITEIEAGMYLIEQGHVPITYTITNKGTAPVKLGNVQLKAYWIKQGSEEKLAVACAGELVLKFSGETERILSAGKSFSTTFDAMVPEKGIKPRGYPTMLPAPAFNPRGIVELLVNLDDPRRIKESREYNNTAKVPVNFNVRDHRE